MRNPNPSSARFFLRPHKTHSGTSAQKLCFSPFLSPVTSQVPQAVRAALTLSLSPSSNGKSTSCSQESLKFPVQHIPSTSRGTPLILNSSWAEILKNIGCSFQAMQLQSHANPQHTHLLTCSAIKMGLLLIFLLLALKNKFLLEIIVAGKSLYSVVKLTPTEVINPHLNRQRIHLIQMHVEILTPEQQLLESKH